MAEPPPATRHRRPRGAETPGQAAPQPRRAVFAFACLLGGSAAAIFTAGGADQGNLGIFLLCAGIVLLVCPPLTPVKPSIIWTASALLLCSAGGLLPARFFHVSAWRRAFAAAPELPLPTTVSADPAQTTFWLAVLLITLLLGLFVLTQPVRSRPMLGFALAGAGICAVYSALSIFAHLSGWHYPFSADAPFGFLPNRNHTATLLVTGSILSVGVLPVAFRERRWLELDLAVASLALCVAGLFFFSQSRGGVVFLLVGIFGWLAGLGRRHRDSRVLLAAVVTLVIGLAMFLLIKSEARDRILGRGSITSGYQPGGDLTSDDRIRIYRDTLGLIGDLPLTGTGLGTFKLVFPQYRQASASPSLILHPESDWLMVAAETGIPALACLGLLVFLTLRNWRPAREHPYWPLRWAFLAAAGTAACHGAVDVPAHRAAVGWWILVLAGLALQPGRVVESGAESGGRIARGVCILGGILSLVLGGMLVRAEWLGGPPLPPFVAKSVGEKIFRTFERGDIAGAIAEARQAVRASPLAPVLNQQLGVLLVRDDENDAEVDRTFLKERMLNPWSPAVVRAQAVAWMPFDAQRSSALFVEALGRQEKLRRSSADDADALLLWRGIVGQTALFPVTQRALWEAAVNRGSRYMLTWLEGADPTVAKERLPVLAADEKFLAVLDLEGRRRFVAAWQRAKADPESLRLLLETRGPDWLTGK